MEPLTTAGGDERSARITLATLAAPGDPLTGKVFTGVGAVETLRLLADDGPVPGLDGISAGLWRGRLRPQAELDRVDRVMERTEQAGLRALIPGDKDYPRGLNDLGYQAPYVLWAAGDTELLGPLDAFAITGTRHATAYGRQMASELAVDLVHNWGVVVAGGASGIDAAVHETALRKGGRTIAVAADRPRRAVLGQRRGTTRGDRREGSAAQRDPARVRADPGAGAGPPEDRGGDLRVGHSRRSPRPVRLPGRGRSGPRAGTPRRRGAGTGDQSGQRGPERTHPRRGCRGHPQRYRCHEHPLPETRYPTATGTGTAPTPPGRSTAPEPRPLTQRPGSEHAQPVAALCGSRPRTAAGQAGARPRRRCGDRATARVERHGAVPVQGGRDDLA